MKLIFFDNIISKCFRPPDDLYKNGIQRSNFLPFIDMLKQTSSIGTIANSSVYLYTTLSFKKDQLSDGIWQF